jgi:hypothetical protein
MDKDIQLKDNTSNPEAVLFSNTPELLFILKKTQKIAYAVFMLSELFDTTEPLRLSLRQGASDLLKTSLSLSQNSRPQRTLACESLLSTLFVTLSYCEAGFFSRLISSMNFDLLKKEIESLAKLIESKMDKRIALEESFLDVGEVQAYKGQSMGHTKSDAVLYKKPEQSSVSAIYPKPVAKKDNQNNQQNRTQLVLAAIKKGQELTIKDIAVSVTGCSEKTIQRELVALVAKGVLKKKGERRWSRYSLI